MDPRQYEAMLADAEIRLKRLRTLYDQWFHGIERAEPQRPKEQLERLIAELKLEQPRNTALRFRLNQLVQRHLTYTSYWQRVTRQIEEGTYKRDVLRARRRFGQGRRADEAPPKPDAYELDLDIDIDAMVDGLTQKSEPPPEPRAVFHSSTPPPARESERPSRAPREITPFAQPEAVPVPRPSQGGAPPRAASGPVSPPLRAPSRALGPGARAASGPVAPPAAASNGRKPPPPPAGSLRPQAPPPPVPPAVSRKPPPPKPAASPAPAAAAAAAHHISDEQILNIYQRYVSARRTNNERIDNVRIETVAKTVRDMLPKLREKHAGKRIDFEVVVKDERVALKPVAK